MPARTRTATVVLFTVSNLLLAGVVASGLDVEGLAVAVGLRKTENVSYKGQSGDPLALSRLLRTDKHAATGRMQDARKGPMTVTRVVMMSETSPADEDIAVQEEFPDVASGESDSLIAPEESHEVVGIRVAPILKQDKATGGLAIGNFKAMTIVGDSEECLNLGYSMLSDAGMAENLLEVMTTSKQITIAKICAANGSVVLSCRTNQITVSPRRSRPDDNCKRPA